MLHAALLAAFAGSVPASTIRAGETVEFSDLALKLALPDLESTLRQDSAVTGCKGDWIGTRSGSDVRVRFHVVPDPDHDFFEPEDVVETFREELRDPEEASDEDKALAFTFGPIRALSGPVGCSPILALEQGAVAEKDDPAKKGLILLAGGLLADQGWALRVEAWPPPDADDTASLVAWLEKCVVHSGKQRDPKWTDAEALAFWKQYAPESTWKKFEKPVRTEHFIFLTNSTSPTLYVKLIESKYAAARKVLPFKDVPGRRLLPVLLFRTNDDFEVFYRKKHELEPKDDVELAGFVFGHVYATSCDRGGERYHALDVAEQVIENRQHTSGGGFWLHLGLQEYAASTPKERLDGLRAVKKGKHTPLAKLLDDEAWGGEAEKLDRKGTSDEADYWEQSAMWMEFLREGPWPKDAFARLFDAVGGLEDEDVAGVTAAIESVYGTDLMTLEKKWVEYFKKR